MPPTDNTDPTVGRPRMPISMHIMPLRITREDTPPPAIRSSREGPVWTHYLDERNPQPQGCLMKCVPVPLTCNEVAEQVAKVVAAVERLECALHEGCEEP